jgi:hypothetical protein
MDNQMQKLLLEAFIRDMKKLKHVQVMEINKSLITIFCLN